MELYLLAILPFLALLLLVAAFRKRGLGWRDSLLFASIPWALFLTFVTEALSQMHLVTRAGSAVSWILFGIACLFWMLTAPSPAGFKTRSGDESAAFSTVERIGFICTVLLVFLVGLTAVVSPPNSGDAVQYHLPRVVSWVNNHSIQFFPTNERQQLDMPPFSEYTMLHLYLLYGSDRLVALVQWLSYAGFIVAASCIARELGANRRTQMVAAVFAATIPSAVLGASGTKNECVLSYWVACAVYFMLRWKRSQSWPLTLAIGASFGMAAFTKGTAYLFLPCMVLACWIIWESPARRRFLFRLPVILGLAVVICFPLWVRNHNSFGSILGLPYFEGAGNPSDRAFRPAHIGPGETAANLARNVALHLGVRSERINSATTRVVAGFIRAIGQDPNDPGQLVALQSSGKPLPFRIWCVPRSELKAGDTLHFALFALAALFYLLYRRKFKGELGWFGLGIAGSFVIYAAMLRWGPFNARYHLPLFVLGSAFAALVLMRALPQKMGTALAALTLLVAFPLALMNDTRPLLSKHGLANTVFTLPREQIYFFGNEDLSSSYIAAAAHLRAGSCRSIGVDAQLQHYDYLMQALLNDGPQKPRLRYVGVKNATVQFAHTADFPLCAVVCLGCAHSPDKWQQYGKPGVDTHIFGDAVVFEAPDGELSESLRPAPIERTSPALIAVPAS